MDTDKCTTKTEIIIAIDTIENVEHYKYLGASFYGNGTSQKEIGSWTIIKLNEQGLERPEYNHQT